MPMGNRGDNGYHSAGDTIAVVAAPFGSFLWMRDKVGCFDEEGWSGSTCWQTGEFPVPIITFASRFSIRLFLERN